MTLGNFASLLTSRGERGTPAESGVESTDREETARFRCENRG